MFWVECTTVLGKVGTFHIHREALGRRREGGGQAGTHAEVQCLDGERSSTGRRGGRGAADWRVQVVHMGDMGPAPLAGPPCQNFHHGRGAATGSGGNCAN